MDIQEIKNLKAESCKQIMKIITDFESETGLEIKSVYRDYVKIGGHGATEFIVEDKIELTIEI